MRRRNVNAGPKDLIWSGSVQWETGPNSPVYAYVFGLDESVVDRVLQHIQEAVIQKEFYENYAFWVEWLGQSRITSEDEVLQGIEESIRIRNPSRHQLDEMWIQGAHMPEVTKAIEVDPLVIDLPTVSFEELAPYCDKPEVLQDFILGVEPSMAPEVIGASITEETMTRRRPSEPRRRNMRRKANSRSIREEVRDRLERRAESRDSRRRPAPRRRVPSSRVAEMREETRRPAPQRRRRTARRDEETRRDERLARLEERRQDRRREERLAFLEERREERRVAARRQRLAELREERQTRRQAAPQQRRRPAAKADPKTASPKKRIYVKADNSANVPAGYYELDESATRQYQAQVRQAAAQKAAAAKKPPRRRKPRK
jgi:hypothetical protein